MKYSVSDVARVLGMTPSALHYFEREGLISVRKEPNGHRFYSIVDIFRMLSYQKYRSMGFPVKTVVKQFSGEENDRRMIQARILEQKEEALAQARHYARGWRTRSRSTSRASARSTPCWTDMNLCAPPRCCYSTTRSAAGSPSRGRPRAWPRNGWRPCRTPGSPSL